jgi:hypothetical protein
MCCATCFYISPLLDKAHYNITVRSQTQCNTVIQNCSDNSLSKTAEMKNVHGMEHNFILMMVSCD